jgi:predicted patatin/cPLA2 family phospholipase
MDNKENNSGKDTTVVEIHKPTTQTISKKVYKQCIPDKKIKNQKTDAKQNTQSGITKQNTQSGITNNSKPVYEINILNLIKIIEINSLVISGGGVKGYLFLGAIKLLFEHNILDKIKYYYGTSAGALIIMCLNLGWDLEEMLKFGSGFPLGCIIDFDIESFMENYGLVPKINSETLFKKIIKYKNFNENITFKELYDLTNKELNFITYSLKTSSAIALNYKTHPNMPIWEGLYMSSALPVLMPPSVSETYDDIFIDGGMIENFPINRVRPENIHKTIGICTESYKSDWDKIKKNILNKDVVNCFDYSLELVKIFFVKGHSHHINNCIKLSMDPNMPSSSSVNFNADSETKQRMISYGYMRANNQLPNIIKSIFDDQINDIKKNHKSVNKNSSEKIKFFHEV